MLRTLEGLVDAALLDDLSGIHREHPITGLRNDPEVVGDQEQRRPMLCAELDDQVQHLGLDGDVEGGGRLIGDQELRLAHQGHGDHRPLPHAARQLMGVFAIATFRFGNPDLGQQVDRSLPGLGLAHLLVGAERCRYLLADREDRVEGGHRFLEDHRDLLASGLLQLLARQAQQIASVEKDRSADLGRGRGQAE